MAIFKMAANGHVGNQLFNGLAYNGMQYMLSEYFWVGKFIFDVIFMIGPIFHLQIQDGRHFQLGNVHFSRVGVEPSY